MATYCEVAPGHPLHGPYHDHEYGFPARDDAIVFERLVLEINQAGLSWQTILAKRPAFQAAYAGFDPAAVAAFDDADRARLLADAGIIRNRLKVDAAITNAALVCDLIDRHGSFAAWLDEQHPLDKADWVKRFKQTGFRFVGGEIVGELLMSLGYLPGAHAETCPVYGEILTLSPPWVGPPASPPKRRAPPGRAG